jgi:acyl carrier protein
LYDKLKSILVDDLELPEEDIRPEATLEEAGMDSLAMVELSLVLEKKCGVRIGDDDLVETATVAQIADLLAELTSRHQLAQSNG